MKDIIQVSPRNIADSTENAILSAINNYYASRVIKDAGIFITATKIQKILDKSVFQQDSTIHFTVEFVALFFRPFVNEVIQGSIIQQSKQKGIRIATGFFNNILVVPSQLPTGATFDNDEKVWMWEYDEQKYFFDTNELVKIRVEQIIEQDSSLDASDIDVVDQTSFLIYGSMKESGLGCVRWWISDQE